MMEENQVLNKFAPFICFASLVLIAVMTISCGSSSSATKPTCTGGPYDVVGVWAINVDGSPYYLPGVINTTGLAIFFKDIGDEAGSEVVMPSITGACSFSENLTLYSTPATVGSGGTYTYPVQGNVQSGPAISGTISEGTSSEFFAGLPIALAPFTPTPLTGSMSVVDTDSPIACHQTYCVQVQVVPSGTGNSADMTLSGTDGFDCNLSGTFTQEGSNAANLNVFDVSLTLTGTTCQVTGTIKGLGFESPADYLNFHPYPPTGNFLSAMSANSADVFEFYP